jgi:hypothetical protein
MTMRRSIHVSVHQPSLMVSIMGPPARAQTVPPSI